MGISGSVSIFKQPIFNVTNGSGSPYQLSNAQSNIIFTNYGVAAEVYINLPANPTNGITFKGVCLDSDLMRFVAQGSQVITVGGTTSGAAGHAQLGAIGSTIELVYFSNTNSWIALSSVGTVNVA